MNCYFGKNGKPLATFIARKIRQWPDRNRRQFARRRSAERCGFWRRRQIVQFVHYRGLGYIEMKRDSGHRNHLHHRAEYRASDRTIRHFEARRRGAAFTKYCDFAGFTIARKPHPEIWQRQMGFICGAISICICLLETRPGRHFDWLKTMRGKNFMRCFSLRDPETFFF